MSANRLGLLLAATLLFVPRSEAAAVAATGRQGVAATVQPLATDAALRAMRNGGNAIDAAVAATLTLGVVDGHNSGIGGGCFMLVRLANGEVLAIDGRETAPAAATRDLFVRDGKADTRLSQLGALAAGVPGSLAACDYAVQKFGKLPLARHLAAAADLAENGFKLDRTYAERLAASAEELRQFEAARAAFLKPDGAPYRAGELLKQPDLAKTYRAIAQHGVRWFYEGPFARETEAWMRRNGGLLTAQDFADYRIQLREPIRTTYRGCAIIGFPPPSSGGVHVAEILNIVEHFDLKRMGAGSADFVHVVTEAMKRAFADRAHWLGDPDFAAVPRGLVSKPYAAALAKQIQMDRASSVPAHGTPERATEDLFRQHTTHFATADAAGNWVACTATINTSFGSKVVIPGTGVVLNNQMDDFAVQPGVANYFGLVGSEANAVGPRKRPLSSMSPTLVLKDGEPVMSVGAAGGPTIISQSVLALLHVIDFGMSVDTALAQPRFHHQWKPDELRIEQAIGGEVLAELRRRGHNVKSTGSLGAAQAIGREPETRVLTAVPDPRGEGKAAGF